LIFETASTIESYAALSRVDTARIWRGIALQRRANALGELSAVSKEFNGTHHLAM
jgi:hypothetical protein